MMKTNYGSVMSRDMTVTKEIEVKTIPVNNLKDVIIGGGLALLGIAYIAVTSFKNGSKAYGVAEIDALHGVGAIDDNDAKALIDGIENC